MTKGGSAEAPTPASWNELFKIPEVLPAEVTTYTSIPCGVCLHACHEQWDMHEISWRRSDA